ncbi:hypothetical protein [Corynebacterium freiburgense]|uniref:hypothetical protein n=1 Tax=Corynebacterium freiburgense TaxID=556548 RepID=UPI0006853BCA|nr:hypothetical protein [Corynebacterium freiburgense]WJZ01977.1 hypothetical protein CFREI_03370 [Corynebacterium freiburgense]
MTNKPIQLRATDIVDLVEAVPGVRGIQASVGTALRTLDARLRQGNTSNARFGVLIQEDEHKITVEVSLEKGTSIRGTVEDVQRAISGHFSKEVQAPIVSVRVISVH